jgi:hypothetical protein
MAVLIASGFPPEARRTECISKLASCFLMIPDLNFLTHSEHSETNGDCISDTPKGVSVTEFLEEISSAVSGDVTTLTLWDGDPCRDIEWMDGNEMTCIEAKLHYRDIER